VGAGCFSTRPATLPPVGVPPAFACGSPSSPSCRRAFPAYSGFCSEGGGCHRAQRGKGLRGAEGDHTAQPLTAGEPERGSEGSREGAGTTVSRCKLRGVRSAISTQYSLHAIDRLRERSFGVWTSSGIGPILRRVKSNIERKRCPCRAIGLCESIEPETALLMSHCRAFIE